MKRKTYIRPFIEVFEIGRTTLLQSTKVLNAQDENSSNVNKDPGGLVINAKEDLSSIFGEDNVFNNGTPF